MIWSNFTKKNLKLFTKFKFLLDNDNLLVKYIKNERNNIKNFIKKNKNYKIKLEKINSCKEIYKFTNSRFVDKQNLLKDMKELNNIFKITWNNNFIIINSNKNIKINNRIKLIIFIIEYLKEKTNNNKDIKIYLILSRLEKYFPLDSKIIDVQNANSGYNDSSNNIIFIWRKEEFEKVLFHELMHNFNLDKRHTHIHNIINIDGPHLYFEAYTDFIGIIYHLIFLSLITNKKIITLLEYELGFIKNQALTLNNIVGNWIDTPNILIEQKTASFSYYILKYKIFEYFIYNEFSELINYNDIINKVLNNKLNININDFIKLNSSRMTLLQLK